MTQQSDAVDTALNVINTQLDRVNAILEKTYGEAPPELAAAMLLSLNNQLAGLALANLVDCLDRVNEAVASLTVRAAPQTKH